MLQLDSDNSELQKQLRSIRTKKAAAASMAKNQSMGRPVNQGEAKELLELQDQMQVRLASTPLYSSLLATSTTQAPEMP